MIPTIILVHHGETIFDVEPGRVQSWSMLPLDENGVKVVGQTAEKLRQFQIWHVVASDIRRTYETGKIIANKLKLQFIPSELLRPWNKGAFVGQFETDVKAACKWFVEHPEVQVPKGEAYRMYFDRWRNGWKWLTSYAEANPGKAVLGVTHSENFASLSGVEQGKMGVYEPEMVAPYGKFLILQKINDVWHPVRMQ